MRIPTTETLASFATRRPRTTIGIWVAVFLIAGVIAGMFLQGNLSSQWRFLSSPESRTADKLIDERLRDPYTSIEAVVVTADSTPYSDDSFADFIDVLIQDIRALGTDVIVSADKVETGQGQTAGLIMVQMAGTADEASESVVHLHEVVDAADQSSQFHVSVSGNATLSNDFITGSENDLVTGEAIGIPFAMIILVIVFGALVAAAIPVVIAVVAIVIALGLAALIGQGFQLSVFVVNVATMMGLAVGIDYSLFIVERYREERRAGKTIDAAIRRASQTSSKSVLFSGATVVLAVTGMFFVPTDLFYSLAIGSILVVIVSVIAALTLLPAVIKLLGDRINRFSLSAIVRRQDAEAKSGFWEAIASLVMGKPVISLVVSAGILVVAAIPYFSINTGLAGVTSMPADTRSRQGFEILDAEFSGGLIAPVILVIDGNAYDPDLQDRIAVIEAMDPTAVTEVAPSGDLTVISFTPHGDASTADAAQGIRDLRETVIPAAFGPFADQVYVTGWAARQTDFTELADRRQLPVIVFVLGLSFLLLLLVFRSVLVPLKAVIMNLLSVGAAYGLMVLVIQKGYGNEFFGFRQAETIDSWIPIFLFAILFGLSMDYHVFLLSRIKEKFHQTDDNQESVAFGLKSTGRIITGAALIMVVVFGGFAAGDLTIFQQMGFGLAVAVLLDATIVRSILVPATMRLLGRRNWYLPGWLNWMPDLNIEGDAEGEE